MTRFSDILTVRLTSEMTDRIAQASAAAHMTVAAWHRQAIRAMLALQGFDLPVAVRPAAGDPEWALVQWRDPRSAPDDEIGSVIVNRSHGAKPDLADTNHHPAGYVPSAGDAWVPVEEADTEPFNPDLHWRLAPPTYEIVSVYDRLDRVRRVYTVVPKSWEHA